ncbi:MAG: STAS domain-containing protein [Olsenella sp.]|nr:STAS domain-containing protein [Olsenella sp.]
MSITIKTSAEGTSRRIAVMGEVDVSNASELRDAVEEAFSSNPSAVEIDLAEVPYIDSTGIGVLVGAAHRGKESGAAVTVSNPQRNVLRVLSMLGVEDELGMGK